MSGMVPWLILVALGGVCAGFLLAAVLCAARRVPPLPEDREYEWKDADA